MTISRRNMLFSAIVAPLVGILPKGLPKKEKTCEEVIDDILQEKELVYPKLVDYNSENDWKLIQHRICLRYRQCGDKSLLPRFWLDNRKIQNEQN